MLDTQLLFHGTRSMKVFVSPRISKFINLIWKEISSGKHQSLCRVLRQRPLFSNISSFAPQALFENWDKSNSGSGKNLSDSEISVLQI